MICLPVARREAAMKDIDLKLKTIDELWTLRETVYGILETRLEAEKRQLEQRLGQLKGTRGFRRQLYPRFRNPNPPHQTWSGRGKRPFWVAEMLQTGKSLDDNRR